MAKTRLSFPKVLFFAIILVIVFFSARKFLERFDTRSYGFPGTKAEWKLPKAALLWTRKNMIMFSILTPWHPVQVTEGESPRWSPDGSRIVFIRGNDVWMMDRDFNKRRLLFKDVVTDGGAFWTSDGEALTAINGKNPHQVLMYTLRSQKVSVLHDESKPPFHNYRLLESAELRLGNRYLLTFTGDDGHHSVIIDLKEKKYIMNDGMKAGDCNPVWAPNGKFLVTTRREWVRPVYMATFAEVRGQGTVGESRYLIGAGQSHWPSISNDSNYIVYSDHTNIFIWHIGTPVDGRRHGVQLTKSPESDISPNIHVFQEQH